LKEYGGSVSGAINKRASFFLDVRRDEVDNGSIINAITLDPQTLAIINPFTDVFRTRQRRFGINPRIDYQLNPRNTLTVRYGFTRADIQGAVSADSIWFLAVHVPTTQVTRYRLLRRRYSERT